MFSGIVVVVGSKSKSKCGLLRAGVGDVVCWVFWCRCGSFVCLHACVCVFGIPAGCLDGLRAEIEKVACKWTEDTSDRLGVTMLQACVRRYSGISGHPFRLGGLSLRGCLLSLGNLVGGLCGLVG